jgi:hypothetical protein
MRSEKETMYRDTIIAHLEHIKEKVDANHNHLEKLNGRVRKTEQSLSWMKGIGGTVTFVISVILTYLGIEK